VLTFTNYLENIKLPISWNKTRQGMAVIFFLDISSTILQNKKVAEVFI